MGQSTPTDHPTPGSERHTGCNRRHHPSRRGAHRNGKPIKSFIKVWRAACLAAGQPGKIPHDFRRTAVRNLVRSGVPERVAMKLTGHKTRSVFERYNIVSDGDLADAARKLTAAGVL